MIIGRQNWLFKPEDRRYPVAHHETLEAALTLKNALKDIDALVQLQIASAIAADGKRLSQAA